MSAGVGTRVGAGSAVSWMSQSSLTGLREDCYHSVDFEMDLAVGSGLGTEVASSSSSGTDKLASSGSEGVGISRTWFVAGSGIKVRSTAEYFSCPLGHSGAGTMDPVWSDQEGGCWR